MLSASKDGTLHLYDTDIRWQHDEDAHLLAAWPCDALKTVSTAESVCCALAPDALSCAVAVGGRLRLYQLDAGSVKAAPHIPCVELGVEGGTTTPFARLLFTADSLQVIAANRGDKHIR